MPVATSKVQRALRQGLFERVVITDSQMNNGQFHNTQLGADEQGVLAEIQVGEDTPVDDALALIVGVYTSGPPNMPGGENLGDSFISGQTIKGRSTFEIQTDTDGDVNVDTRVGLGGHKQATVADDNVLEFRREEEVNTTDQSIVEIEPVTPWDTGHAIIGDGGFLTLVVDPGANAQTFGFDHCSVRIEALKWDGRGL